MCYKKNKSCVRSMNDPPHKGKLLDARVLSSFWDVGHMKTFE
jgi:hypothetical protein